MEKTDRAMVLPVDIGWKDVGSWSALWEVSEQDGDANARHRDVIAAHSPNSYAYARRLVALVGVAALVVVDNDDAVLVSHQDQVQPTTDDLPEPKSAHRTPTVRQRTRHLRAHP